MTPSAPHTFRPPVTDEAARAADSAQDLTGYRVVAVHAHPDDEALFTGGTLAQLSRRGAHVTVVTCTLGEEGEVIGQPFQYLTVDHADQLGGFRVHELQTALQILGVDGEFLGQPGKYRDSGMAGSPAHDNPRAFVNNTAPATDDLVEILNRLKPHAVITYGPDGAYGHPDHIAAHTITHAAVDKASHKPERIWWCVIDRDETYAALDTLGAPEGWSKPDTAYLDNFTTAGHDVAVNLTPSDVEAKRLSMAAHATQIWVADGSVSTTNPEAAQAEVTDPELSPYAFALSNLLLMPLGTREHFQLGWGSKAAELLGGLDRDK